MKAKRVFGIVATVAISVSTVLGPAMPVLAEGVDGSAVADTTVAADANASAPAADSALDTGAAPAVTADPAATDPAAVTADPAATVDPAAVDPATVIVDPAAADPSVVTETPAAVTEAPAADTSAPAEESAEPEEEGTEEEVPAEEEAAFAEEEELESSEGTMTMMLTAFSDDEGAVGITAESLESSLVADTSKPAAPAIELDGDFSDWEGHEATAVNDGLLSYMDMIWSEDGGLYIYLQEADGNWGAVAQNVGGWYDGRYVITSDTGRQMVFILRVDTNTGEAWLQDADGNRFEDAEVVYVKGEIDTTTWQPTGGKYEIKIPSSMVKSYNESVSLGYYLSENQKIVADVANPYIAPVEAGTVSDIAFDGNYGDWDNIVGQELIMYSTDKADAEAKLLTDDANNILNVFVQAYKEGQYQDCFNFFELAINGDYNNGIGFQLLYLGDDGYLPPIEGLNDGTPGTYTYYIGGVHEGIWNYGEVQITPDSTDANHPILGQMYLTIDATGKVSTESQIDLNQIAYWLGVDGDNMKEIDMRWIRIGDKWITAAGTSTGPIPGILMGVGVAAFAAWGIKKREEGVPSTAEN